MCFNLFSLFYVYCIPFGVRWSDFTQPMCLSGHRDIPGLLLVSLHNQQPVWDGLTVTLRRSAFYWFNKAQLRFSCFQVYMTCVFFVRRSPMGSSWCKLALDFNVMRVSLCHFRKGKKSLFLLWVGLANELKGKNIEKENTSSAVWPKRQRDPRIIYYSSDWTD